MIKSEKFLDQSTEFLSERFSENILLLEQKLKKEEVLIMAEIQNSLQNCIDKSLMLQSEGVKGEIKYISFSMLLSSIIAEKYSFGIEFYDERFYLDESTVFSEWKLDFIKAFIDLDIAELDKNLRKERIFCTDNELIEIKKAQAIPYILVYVKWLKANIPLVMKELKVTGISISEQVDISFGMYLESQERIYTWEVAE